MVAFPKATFSLPWLLAAWGAVVSSHGDENADALSKCAGYTATNVVIFTTGLSADLFLEGEGCGVYGDDLSELRLDVTYETDSRLHVKIQDVANQVYQVPESVIPRPRSPGVDATASQLKFDFSLSPFSFTVARASTGEILFDTSAASLVFETQYLRLRTRLPHDPNLYGLGEHADPLRLPTTGYIRTLWNRDSPFIPERENLYGSHPFYLEHRGSGSHGVFLLNSNGMDVMIDREKDGSQYLEYNTLGGVLDFYFVAGPSPVQVSQQYAEIVGLPANMPYWGLGFQQCKYGYRDAFEVAEVVQNYSNAKIPLETMWVDIDYMDGRRVFSLDPKRFPLHQMRGIVDHLHANDQKFVLMVDPAVAYDDYPPFNRGAELNAFLRYANGSIWKGVVWPGVTSFPDWFSSNATRYWNEEFRIFFSPETGVDVDALWIDMNEPSNFGCNFPCEHPETSAKGFPPKPPPVRDPPRPLPGWPCDLQPRGSHCELEEEDRAPSFNVELELGPEAEGQVVISDMPNIEGRNDPAASGQKMGLPGRNLLYPKYAIHNNEAYRPSWNADKGGLSNRTVSTDVVHQNGLVMYDTHNMFGLGMSIASRAAMLARRPGLRPMVITRSTFSSSGAHVGHWLGDNKSTWDKYRASIRTLLAFTSIYQVPMAGSDVCGFNGNTTEELCARWASLGAFSPFYRNHNDLNDTAQEFYLWDTVAESARRAIDIRYRLLDYIYTALYKQTLDGTPLLSPMFYVYPNDPKTFGLDLQYFYGPGLLVAPVTEKKSKSVDIYLPNDVFYDWYSHRVVQGLGTNITVTDQGLTDIPLFLRGGVIVPARVKSGMTTAVVREQNFELLIPLSRTGVAKGELYLDDGVSIKQPHGAVTLINLDYKDGILTGSGMFGFPTNVIISKITLLGAPTSGKDDVEEQASQTWKVHIPLTGAFEVRIL